MARERVAKAELLKRFEPRAAAAAVTVLLHLLVAFALVHVTASVIEPPPPPTGDETTADRLRGGGDGIVSVDIGTGLTTTGLACEGSSYIGVGVTAERGTERIILVGDNTPASRAGLQHDDVVLNPDVWQGAHEDGALLHVLILRRGVKMAVRVRVGRICIG